MKKDGRTMTNKVKKVLYSFYMALEKPLHPKRKIRKKTDKKIHPLIRTNNVMKVFYKRPELMIEDFENLEYFDFYNEHGLKLDGVAYTPNPDSNKWVVACHWFAGHKQWALHHAKAFAKLGWNVLAFDFRGHGESDKSATNVVDEYLDLVAALNWLKENKKVSELALMGTSLGAYVVNYVSLVYADLLKELNLKMIVSDCGFVSIYSLFLHIKNVYLKFIRKVQGKKFVLKQIQAHKKRAKDLDFDNIDVIKAIEDGHKPTVPGLYFHSKDDAVTPPTDTYEILLKRNPYIKGDRHKVYTYAMHTQAIRIHFKSFNYELATFINEHSPDKARFSALIDEWKLLEKPNEKKDVKAKNLE